MWCVNVKAVEGNRKLRLRVVEVGMGGGGGVGHHSAYGDRRWERRMRGEKERGKTWMAYHPPPFPSSLQQSPRTEDVKFLHKHS